MNPAQHHLSPPKGQKMPQLGQVLNRLANQSKQSNNDLRSTMASILEVKIS